MYIVARVRNNENEVIGYIVNLGGTKTKYFTLKEVITQHRKVPFTNAVEINGMLRAKKGYKIPTTVFKAPVKHTAHSKNRLEIPCNKNSEEFIIDKGISGYDTLIYCRRLRNAIKLGKLRVDTNPHKANEKGNVQYFKFIEACGFTVESFVKQFLYNLQPCMARFVGYKNRNESANITIILATGYDVNMYIKFLKDYSVVVSFHDDSLNGRMQSKAGLFRDNTEYAYLLSNSNIYGGETIRPFLVSRGFSTLNFRLLSKRVADDVAIVRVEDLRELLMENVTNAIMNLYSEYLDDTNSVKATILAQLNGKTALSRLSFTSYGGYTLTVISLLIDLYSWVRTDVERQVIQTALECVIDEEVTPEIRQEVTEALKERYGTNKKLLDKTATILSLCEGKLGII